MIEQIRRSLPRPIRSSIKRTPIGRLYRTELIQHARARMMTPETASISTEAGTVLLYVSPTSSLTKTEYPGFEPGLVDRLVQAIDRETVYYDIGAGYGYNLQISLLAGALPDKIHLFETSSFRTRFLKKNAMGKMHVNKVFVSDSDGKSSTRIDTYTESAQSPDVVTIDIEGSEYRALCGMWDTIDDCKPELLIEVHPDKLDVRHQKIMDELRARGYSLSARDHRQMDSNWISIEDQSDAPLSYKTNSPTYLLRAV